MNELIVGWRVVIDYDDGRPIEPLSLDVWEDRNVACGFREDAEANWECHPMSQYQTQLFLVEPVLALKLRDGSFFVLKGIELEEYPAG